jgi:hypothetical protein
MEEYGDGNASSPGNGVTSSHCDVAAASPNYGIA